MWRAIRHGLDGRMIDFDAGGEEYPSAQIAERLLEWTAPVRAELDIEPSFGERNGAQRQRAMSAAGASDGSRVRRCGARLRHASP